MPTSVGSTERQWSSDLIALQLRDLDFEYVALNPGASYRGLHDSIVNRLGNKTPRMVTSLHEEHAVAIAHGYAKVTGVPMLVGLHTNVGLMHASMAIFNAWCDRVPVVILGSNGPTDAAVRRPWIDWLHTTADQAALVRSFTKWDDEPRSVEASAESLVRATAIACQLPAGPVYVAFDAGLQEAEIEPGAARRQLTRAVVSDPMPSLAELEKLRDRLVNAARPVLLLGRGAGTRRAWDARVELAEALNARVITDLRTRATFPTDHPLHLGPPGLSLNPDSRQAIAESDFVLALDCVDLEGSLRQAGPPTDPGREVLAITMDPYVHNGWSKDHQALPMAASMLLGDPDQAVAWLVGQLDVQTEAPAPVAPAERPAAVSIDADDRGVSIRGLGQIIRETFEGEPTTFVRFPIGWPGESVDFRDPLDFLGTDGGGGLGSGPGLVVGAGLGLRGTDRLPVAVLGDGDFLMGCTALWSACAQGVGLLVVVSNNRSYFNDELHQEHMARLRGRPVENRWVGQRLDDPPVDIASISRAQGAVGYGPILEPDEIRSTLRSAIDEVRAGKVVVVDVLVRAEYDQAAASTVSR